MRAAGFDGKQCTRHFVFALRTAFKPCQALGNAPSNGLVVASLKVQAVHAL